MSTSFLKFEILLLCILPMYYAFSQCEVKTYETSIGANVIQNQYEIIEKVIGSDDNEDYSEGFKITQSRISKIYLDDRNYYLLDITSSGTGLYENIALPRKITFYFSDGSMNEIVANEKRSLKQNQVEFKYEIASNIILKLSELGIANLVVEDYKEGSIRSIDLKYGNFLRDQIACIEKNDLHGDNQVYQIIKVTNYEWNELKSDYLSAGEASFYKKSFLQINENNVTFWGEELNMTQIIKSTFDDPPYTVYDCQTNGWASRIALDFKKNEAVLYFNYDDLTEQYNSYSICLIELIR